MKACSKCGEVKSLDCFYSSGDGRLKSQCKACILAARRERYATDAQFREAASTKAKAVTPEVRRERRARRRSADPAAFDRAHRDRHLRREYGITIEQFDEMFEAQGSVCAICRLDEPGRAWSVDHDHDTGAVRGVLCWHCNIALGHFRDDPLRLASAIKYLAVHEQVVPA